MLTMTESICFDIDQCSLNCICVFYNYGIASAFHSNDANNEFLAACPRCLLKNIVPAYVAIFVITMLFNSLFSGKYSTVVFVVYKCIASGTHGLLLLFA